MTRSRIDVVMAGHRFELTSTVERDDAVVVEAVWTGTVAIDAGKLARDQTLTAHVCMVFEFEDGLIRRQRNYDCYDPF